MFYVVTALYSEAKPIIQYYNLKKIPEGSRFQIFKNNHMALVISGIGALPSAVATSHLLTRFSYTKTDSILNIGICGAVDSADRDIKEGDAFLCHKIIHHETKKSYYPDILLKHSFREGSLETFAHPVEKEMERSVTADLVDMEAAGFYEAASSFLSPHQIYCVKIVSDFLETAVPTPQKASGLIENNISSIVKLVDAAREATSGQKDILTDDDFHLLAEVGLRLHLSQTLIHQLHQRARQYKIRTGDSLNIIQDFIDVKVKTKNEGKVYFEKIKQKLIHS